VTAGRAIDGETVVAAGLRAGELVVTDGHLRVVAGARLELKGAADRATPPRP
jgi:multidrug efflux pump subunit AcrA (membrane-fusion protein)